MYQVLRLDENIVRIWVARLPSLFLSFFSHFSAFKKLLFLREDLVLSNPQYNAGSGELFRTIRYCLILHWRVLKLKAKIFWCLTSGSPDTTHTHTEFCRFTGVLNSIKRHLWNFGDHIITHLKEICNLYVLCLATQVIPVSLLLSLPQS